jgi:hypothetical protein
MLYGPRQGHNPAGGDIVHALDISLSAITSAQERG